MLLNAVILPDWAETFIIVLSMMIILVGLIQNIVYAWSIPHAWLEINERSQKDDTHAEWELLRSETSLPITIVVPAYNEEATIRESVMALLNLHYPDYQIIVVNDGSKDKTAETMVSAFEMHEVSRVRDVGAIKHNPIRQIYGSDKYSNLLFVDKENGKKADAINAGLTCVRTPLFCVIDADSLLDPNALLKAIRPFVETSKNVIAVGGTIGIVNGCTIRNGHVEEYDIPKTFLARIQVVEYIRAFLMARLAASRKGTLTLISGAFGIFRREIAVAVGGYDTSTVGEDLELVLKMHNYMNKKGEDYEVMYIPEPVCWTEVPESLKILGRQRVRWQRGALECLSRHKYMLFNRRFGRLGMITMPLFLLVDIIGPIVELLGLILMPIFWLLGWLSLKFFLAYTALIFSFGIFISTMAIFIEQDEIERFSKPRHLVTLLLTATVENFGYRQLSSFWRMKGVWQHFTNKKASWGAMERRGFKTADSASSSSTPITPGS